MTKTTIFSKISNIVFLFLSIFCLFFLWSNFYIKNFSISLICSVIVIITASIIYFTINYHLNKSRSQKNNKIKNIEHFQTQLLYSSDENISNLITTVYNLDVKNVIKNHIITKTSDYYFCFTRDITEFDIIEFIKNRETDDITIFAINNLKSYQTIENVKIKVITISEFFNQKNDKNIDLKSNIIVEKKAKIRFKDIIRVVLCKERSKGYFGFGLLLIFSSLFTPYNIYYQVVATLLIILSIFSRFNHYFN